MTASLTFPLSGVRLATWVVCVSLAGCGGMSGVNRDTFRPYVPEVVQGNFVSKEQRQAIAVGMPSAQVRDLLGTPLVTSLFHTDRWDYAFSIRRQGVAQQQFQLTVFFKDDLVSALEGGDLPSDSEFVERLVAPRQTNRVPKLQASEEELRQFPSPPSPAPAQRPAALPANYPPLEPTLR